MKAKEYFEKYDRLIIEEPPSRKHLSDFVGELLAEAETLMKDRKCATNASIKSVFTEINDKYNSVAAMYEKKYGKPVLSRNGFLKYARANIPELDILFRERC